MILGSDFGVIFSDLLPGNTAKLEPPEGKTIMDGLEVKVRLGSVWKHSLTELSGGQRFVFDTFWFILTFTLFKILNSSLFNPIFVAVQACTNVYSR
jgi:hypothetical protein